MVKRIVGISGNIGRPSKTRRLVEGVVATASARGLGDAESYDLLDAGPTLGTTTSRDDPAPALAKVWSSIEGCDALVVGSPVYKGSYSGLFKHLFDLIGKDALVGRPVVLCATSRIAEHALVIEHQFRPLFSFFGCVTMPFGLHATHENFDDEDGLRPELQGRIAKQVDFLAMALSVR